jgi:hypothetical protein
MKNLSKTEFWDPAKDKFPNAVEAFCKWIDEYKEMVGWNGLFGVHETSVDGRLVCVGVAPKFHDIPYEMQMGIMNRFFIEMFAGKEEYEQGSMREENYHGEMKIALEQLERKLVIKEKMFS